MARATSTFDEAKRALPELAGPTWFLAHEQTAARGRRGRAWSSPKGNFGATLVLPIAEPPEQAALRSFVAALALRDAFGMACGRPDGFALKWPNDVLLNGGKVAGILLESWGPMGETSHLAIGIGVNLAEAPPQDQLEPNALRAVSLMSETGTAIDPEDFLTLLAAAYARHETQFQNFGFGPIRTAWLQDAANLGQPIRAVLPKETLHGTFRDMDETGQLVLQTADGLRTIAAGEVFFGG